MLNVKELMATYDQGDLTYLELIGYLLRQITPENCAELLPSLPEQVRQSLLDYAVNLPPPERCIVVGSNITQRYAQRISDECQRGSEAIRDWLQEQKP